MADVETIEEVSAFPEKRKADVPNSISKTVEETKEQEEEADFNKKRKLQVPTEERNGTVLPSSVDGKAVNQMAPKQDEEHLDDDEDEDEYKAEDDEDEGGQTNGEAEVVDRKGKGILMEDKGKGKMLDSSDDEDDDDDSSDDSDSDFSDGLDDSDLEDDPLAEVDLDNILPSRTRHRGAQPGLRISSDQEKGPNA